jgi:membrane-associated phospholipid phosphatase
MRPIATALLLGCVAITALLGALLAHHAREDALDAAADAGIRAGVGGYPAALDRLVMIGDWLPVAVAAAALFLACLMARSWRGAVLVAVAVPGAHGLTERVLKPLVGRTLPDGTASFPSGHEARVFTLAVVLAVLLAGPLRPSVPGAIRLLLVLAALALAGAVAVALVARHAHYFTDTVGGAAVGTAVVLVTAFFLDWLVPVLQGQPLRHRVPS